MQQDTALGDVISGGVNVPVSNFSLLKDLTDHLPVALYQFLKYPNGESRFLFVSRALTSIFEVTPEELLADDRALSKRVHPDDIERVNNSIDESAAKMEIWDCQFRAIIPDKGIRWVRGVARPEKLEDGGVLSNGYLEDITEQKKVNDWIRYLNTAMMNISESIIISNNQGRIIYANQKVKELHGYEPEEIIGMPSDMMNVNPMSEEEFAELIATLRSGRTYTGREYSRRKDGSVFLCEFSVTPIQGDDMASGIGVQKDITERTQIMEALKEANDRFEQLTQHSRAIACEVSQEGIFKYVSGAVQTVLGYQPDELVMKMNVFDLVLPSKQESVRALFDSSIKDGVVFSDYKCPLIAKDGSIVYLSINGIPKSDEKSNISTCRVLAIDITEKEKMEQLIAEENEKYKTTLLSVGEGIISVNSDGKITVMNPMAEKLTGWSQKDAIGKNLSEILKIINEENGTLIENPADMVLSNAASYQPPFPTVLISSSGSRIPIELIAAPIKNFSGSISGVVTVFKDFVEYREKQKQIEFLSFNDTLTGLYNRRYFERAIKEKDKKENYPLAIMIMDANGLKLANDAFGHKTGDGLLCIIADILRNVCGQGDIAARIGGDEFALLLHNTDAAKAEKFKQKIHRAAMKRSVDSVIVSLSIGYSVKTNPDEKLENIFINADNHMYKEKFSQGKSMQNKTIEAVLNNINAKFEQEKYHTERVSQYSYLIANALNLSSKEKNEIRLAGLLHDIGKIVIPSDLLNKKERLTEEEYNIIKRHPETGYQILKSVDDYIAISLYVLHHHERWDGSGYPSGLRGSDIPLQSRIISVADTFEAMTSKRAYQKTKTVEEAIAELERCSGAQFDPEIVRVFIDSVLVDKRIK